jgi:hypothetical protein
MGMERQSTIPEPAPERMAGARDPVWLMTTGASGAAGTADDPAHQHFLILCHRLALDFGPKAAERALARYDASLETDARHAA